MAFPHDEKEKFFAVIETINRQQNMENEVIEKDDYIALLLWGLEDAAEEMKWMEAVEKARIEMNGGKKRKAGETEYVQDGINYLN